MARRVGLLTIGQAPRADGLAREMAKAMDGVEVVEAGALDGLTAEDVRALAPQPGDETLVTLLADGQAVTIGRDALLPRLRARVAALCAEGAEVVALLCTGAFPDLAPEGTPPGFAVFQPHGALRAVVAELARGRRLGVLLPHADQAQAARESWAARGLACEVAVASPYADAAEEDVRRAAEALRRAGCGLVFMDCFGYSLRHKAVARRSAGAPVVLARTLAARLLSEWVGGDGDG